MSVSARAMGYACARFKPAGDAANRYFFDPGVEAAVPFAEGAAAMVFGFTCFGFLVSRPPFAMDAPPDGGVSLAPSTS
jgi:hypothetical protein